MSSASTSVRSNAIASAQLDRGPLPMAAVWRVPGECAAKPDAPQLCAAEARRSRPLRAILFLLLFVLAVRLLTRAVGRSRERPAGGDPWQVLGVKRGASAPDIHSAYRRRMAEYHPDKVQSLGPELRELAARRAVEINEAYRVLRGRS